MTWKILLLLQKRYNLFKRWHRLQKLEHKQLFNKMRNLVQRKIQAAKNRTSKHITKRLDSLC